MEWMDPAEYTRLYLREYSNYDLRVTSKNYLENVLLKLPGNEADKLLIAKNNIIETRTMIFGELINPFSEDGRNLCTVLQYCLDHLIPELAGQLEDATAQNTIMKHVWS